MLTLGCVPIKTTYVGPYYIVTGHNPPSHGYITIVRIWKTICFLDGFDPDKCEFDGKHWHTFTYEEAKKAHKIYVREVTDRIVNYEYYR